MKIYNCLKKMFFLQLILIFCGYTETSLLEEIIAGIRYNNSLIKNWRAICKINVENEKKETIKEEELWAKKGDKIYREKRKENGEISYVVSFDGENLRIWGNNKKGLIKVPTDDDLKRAFYNISSPLFLYEFVRFQNEPLINFLSNKSENKEIKFRGEINLQNEKCYLIEVEVVKENLNSKYQFYLSQSYGFYPVKTIIREKSKYGETQTITTTTFQKLGNVIFPKKAVIESFMNFTMSPFGNLEDYKGSSTYILEFDKIEINKDIPDNFFQIEFPKETKVWDDRIGVNYTIR